SHFPKAPWNRNHSPRQNGHVERVVVTARRSISPTSSPAKPWDQRSRRRNLARLLHTLRSWIHRFGAEDLAAPRQPLRQRVVTYVLGTFCHPCLRAGHFWFGGDAGILL